MTMAREASLYTVENSAVLHGLSERNAAHPSCRPPMAITSRRFKQQFSLFLEPIAMFEKEFRVAQSMTGDSDRH
jgi:hypothetical protein